MNTIKEPLISIITVSYNAANTIEQTILSVINQNFKDFEYIVIDGGSTDGTVDIIKKYQDKITFWVSEPDKGIYDAMNKGIQIAKGEWVNFMNAGDGFYNSNVFVNVFGINRTSDVIYGDNMLCYNWGKIILAPDVLSKTNQNMVFGHQTVFMKRDIVLKYQFDCNYRIAADYDLFFKVYRDEYIFEYIPICISNFSADDGVSTNNPIITFLEDSKINGRNKNSNWYFVLFIYKIRLYLRKWVMLFLTSGYVEKIKKKNILKNKLIKEIILQE